MLVLTRKRGERVLIGDDIVVTVLEIKGDGVRIGVEAPQGVRIQRHEIFVALAGANVEAAGTDAASGQLLADLLAARAPKADPPAAGPAAPSAAPGDGSATESPAQ